MGNDSCCTVTRIGIVKLKMHDGVIKTLSNVRFVPDLKRNLISLGVLDASGFCYKAQNGTLKVTKGSLVVMKAEKKNGLYLLNGVAVTGSVAISSPIIDDKTSLWHRRLAHVSEKGLIELSEQGLLCGDKLKNMSFYEHYVYGKMSRVKFNVGVVRHKTVRKTPQQNGLAERMNKTILESVRSMLSCANLSVKLWAEATHTVIYLINRTLFSTEFKTPLEKWTNHPVDYEGVKGYKFWNPTTRKCIISRDVVFKEDELVGYNLVRDRTKRISKPTQRYGFADTVAYALQVVEEITE
ncbi:hypothetical protein EZV62_014572 [Acer yangbiense]|uniref:Integrase catalytic domain-containing protein n=1 Tax=Acer yangbiense TaxID=1000413 RepID=A0A5C7HTD5_9ROSI|nr:hypothetical protein EZV62_014572 [Acer yangbiense]